MKFVIKITYMDGDSFKSYIDHETLDYSWSDENVVVKNMIAIKEHYEAYRKSCGYYSGEKDNEDYKSKWWYMKPKYYMESEFPCGLNLSLDDGSLFYYHCPWCGYFASLLEVEMGIKTLKFEFN